MVVLSEATMDDISKIQEIVYDSITDQYADMYPKNKLNALRTQEKNIVRELIVKRKYSAHMVEHDTQNIGFSCVDLRFGILNALYICPAHMSQGYGKKVLRECELSAESECGGLSVTAIPEARDFYTKNGYRTVQTTDIEINSIELSSVILVKKFQSSYEVPDFIL